MTVQIRVTVPGSCGELVQGTVRGVPFLITCPVNIFTRVIVSTAEPGGHSGLGRKSQLALARTLEYLGVDSFPFHIRLKSELPIGKGMASSSADIAAVCIAAAATFGETLTADEISRLAAGVEPTDGIFFPGVVRMNQMTGKCFESFGELPALQIAAFDCGGAVDTLSFHERADLGSLNRQNEALVSEALTIFQKNPTAEGIAEAATKSALANQSILYKDNLEKLVADVKEMGALGINAAHSGTVIGVLFAPDGKQAVIDKVVDNLMLRYHRLRFLQQMKLISGGYKIKIDR